MLHLQDTRYKPTQFGWRESNTRPGSWRAVRNRPLLVHTSDIYPAGFPEEFSLLITVRPDLGNMVSTGGKGLTPKVVLILRSESRAVMKSYLQAAGFCLVLIINFFQHCYSMEGVVAGGGMGSEPSNFFMFPSPSPAASPSTQEQKQMNSKKSPLVNALYKTEHKNESREAAHSRYPGRRKACPCWPSNVTKVHAHQVA